jgi:hypothetical protein
MGEIAEDIIHGVPQFIVELHWGFVICGFTCRKKKRKSKTIPVTGLGGL